jgi:hypothetical protein
VIPLPVTLHGVVQQVRRQIRGHAPGAWITVNTRPSRAPDIADARRNGDSAIDSTSATNLQMSLAPGTRLDRLVFHQRALRGLKGGAE